MRIIYGSDQASTHRRNGILSIENTYNYFFAIKLYNELNSGAPSYFNSKVESLQPVHPHDTRFVSNSSLVSPRYSSARGQKSFLFQVIAFWNKLPSTLRNSRSFAIFKRNLKAWIFSHC